jgi:hypothetical protein
MALARFVLTGTVTIPAAPAATVVAGEPGTGGAAGYGNTSVVPAANAWGPWPTTFLKGTTIYADSSGAGGAGALYTAIGAGNLRAYVQGQDDVGHAALSNLPEVISMFTAGAARRALAGLTAVVRLFLRRGPTHLARPVVAIGELRRARWQPTAC